MENTVDQKDKKKFKPIYVILPLVLIIGGYFAFGKVRHALDFESTDNAQVESNAIPVLSRISGYTDSVYISDYQEVKAGQELLKIDDREYAIAVAQAEADLLQAEADLAAARAGLRNVDASEKVASANSEVMKTRLQKALSDYARDEAMFNDGSITKKQLEDSRSNVETARTQLYAGNSQINQANVQSGSADAQIKKAEALIATRKAALDQAKLRLSYATLTAPVSGRIGRKAVETGQYVQPGQNLFTIVNNEDFWIVANFKETQMKDLHQGSKAEIFIDSYPDQLIEGTIESFSEATGAKYSLLPPDNASGNFVKVTQRVPVKIRFTNTPELKKILKAGLSARVDVRVN